MLLVDENIIFLSYQGVRRAGYFCQTLFTQLDPRYSLHYSLLSDFRNWATGIHQPQWRGEHFTVQYKKSTLLCSCQKWNTLLRLCQKWVLHYACAKSKHFVHFTILHNDLGSVKIWRNTIPQVDFTWAIRLALFGLFYLKQLISQVHV